MSGRRTGGGRARAAHRDAASAFRAALGARKGSARPLSPCYATLTTGEFSILPVNICGRVAQVPSLGGGGGDPAAI
eukprot:2460119-Pyramimonas_sp.AAC.1